jgi:DnaJ-class molecular chaperone
LIIEIAVANDSNYRLDGKDIIRTVEVPFHEAILGSRKI